MALGQLQQHTGQRWQLRPAPAEVPSELQSVLHHRKRGTCAVCTLVQLRHAWWHGRRAIHETCDVALYCGGVRMICIGVQVQQPWHGLPAGAAWLHPRPASSACSPAMLATGKPRGVHVRLVVERAYRPRTVRAMGTK